MVDGGHLRHCPVGGRCTHGHADLCTAEGPNWLQKVCDIIKAETACSPSYHERTDSLIDLLILYVVTTGEHSMNRISHRSSTRD